MTTIDDFLERATDTATKQARIEYPPNNISGFVDEQYELRLGKKFGQWHSQFWYDKDSGVLLIDIRYLHHTIANTINGLENAFLPPKTEHQKLELAQRAKAAATITLQYLGESLGLFDTGLIDFNGETLFYPNKQIYNGLQELAARLRIIIDSVETGFGTEELKSKVRSATQYFNSFRHKYSIIPDKPEQEFIRAYRKTRDQNLLADATRRFEEEYAKKYERDYGGDAVLLGKVAKHYAKERIDLLVKTFVDNGTGN